MDGFNLIFGLIMIASFIGLMISAKKHHNSESAKKLAFIFAGVVLVTGISIAVHNLFYDKSAKFAKIENGYVRSIAFVLGEDLAKRFPKAKVLVIVGPNYKQDHNQLTMIDGLKDGMNSKMTKIDVHPLRVKIPKNYKLSDSMKAKDFNALVKISRPSVIVSLVGLPDDFQKLKIWAMYEEKPEKTPKLAIINGDISRLFSAIKTGIVAAVVRYKPDVFVDENDFCPSDYKKAFEKRYLLITPKNVEKIKKKYGKKIFK